MIFDPLLAAAREPAFVLDPLEDRFIGANRAGCTMLGYTYAELLQTPISRIHPGELPQLHDFVGRVLRDGHGTTITLTCRTRSGTCLPTEMALHAFEDEGHVVVLALIRDRSEHRRGPGPTEARHSRHSAVPETLGETNEHKESPMVTTSLMVRLEAKAGHEAELASFLEDALPLVQAEPQTIAWFALQTGPSSFAIVDAFPDEQGRQAHLNGAVAASLLARADELLTEPPEIQQVDVLAAKLP